MMKSSRIQELSRTICIPYVHILLCQLVSICRTSYEPQQLLYQASPEDTLCGQQRKLTSQVKSRD